MNTFSSHSICWVLSRCLLLLATPIIKAQFSLIRCFNHSKRTALKLSMLGICTTLVIACNSTGNTQMPSAGSDCRVVKHDVGETEVCGQPQKVVALGPYALDLLLSLGVQPAGYADYFSLYRGDYFDNPSQQIPYLGSRLTNQPMNLGTGDQPSLEELVQLKPDLIVGETGGNKNNYALLSQIAPTLLLGKRIEKDNWKHSIQEIAKALGREDQAEQVLLEHKQRLAANQAELVPFVKANPQVLLLGGNQLNENIRVFGSHEFIGGLLKDLGFQIIALPEQQQKHQVTLVSPEVLPSLNAADTIFVLGYDLNPGDYRGNFSENQMKNIKQEWSNQAITQTLKADKEGRVYFVPYYLWNGLNGPIGTELVLEELRQLLL